MDNKEHLPGNRKGMHRINDPLQHRVGLGNLFDMYCMIPWSPSTCPFGSPLVSSSVVLFDPALWVHSKADVNTAFIFWIGAVQHVHPEKTFNFDNHDY